MSNNTTMIFTLLGRDKLGPTFDAAGKKAEGLGKKLGGMAKVGAAAGVAIGAGIVASLPKIANAAAELELMGKKAERVFGSQLGMVEAWAKTNAHAMGLTTREAIGLAAGLQDLLVPMGVNREAAAQMSTQVAGLSGALAEWSGGTKTASEVGEVLQAALLGERDALQSLGIGISQAQVDAQVLANQKRGLKFATEEQAQAQATLDLIMLKSKDAQAAFAAGGGTLARRMAESRASLKEVAQELLVSATPALTSLAKIVQERVLPQVVKFGNWLAGPGKFVVADWALSGAQMVLGFADKFLAGLEVIIRFVGRWGKALLRSMAVTLAPFNLSLAKSMFAAADEVEGFADSTLDSLAGARRGIQTTEEKIARAKLVAKLNADKAQLDAKLKAARLALQDPNLTKERRAQLNADIRKLTAGVTTAQRKIDGLKGKTVTVTLHSIVSKQFASLLSGRLDYFGRPIGGSGGSGGMGRALARGTYRRGVPFGGYPGHTGQDLPARVGTPVYAPFAGTLDNTDLGNRSYGKYVSIQAGQWRFIGAHLSAFARREGFVGKGQLVGYVGSTGNSTGPHLHAELRRNGRAVNPLGILPYDAGGWLPRGLSMVWNGTSRPEAVFTSEQLRDLRGDGPEIDYDKLADALAKGRPINVDQHFPEKADPDQAVQVMAERLLGTLGS